MLEITEVHLVAYILCAISATVGAYTFRAARQDRTMIAMTGAWAAAFILGTILIALP